VHDESESLSLPKVEGNELVVSLSTVDENIQSTEAKELSSTAISCRCIDLNMGTEPPHNEDLEVQEDSSRRPVPQPQGLK
jgi:hypothetical protein